MITGKDCRQEYTKANEVVKTEELKSILKTNEVNNKVLLNVRLMLSKVMEVLKIPKIEPKRRDNKKEDAVEIGNDKVLSLVSENKGKIDVAKK